MSMLPSNFFLQLKPRVMAWCVFVSVFGFSVVTLSFLFLQAREQQKEGFYTRVQRLATVVASMIDPALHEQLCDESQMNGELYRSALRPLVRLHLQVPDAQYIYTMRTDGAGEERFVLDTANDAQVREMLKSRGFEVTPSALMEPYEVPNDKRVEEGRQARRAGRAYVYREPYHDAYGTFISAEAPLFDADGKQIGYAGADYRLDVFDANMADLQRTGLISLGFALVLSVLLSRLAYEMRVHVSRQLEQVSEAEQQARMEKQRAEAAAVDKAHLLAVASHDLKNPLAAIESLAEQSLEELRHGGGLSVEAMKERLQLMSQASTQMRSLIRDILVHEGLEQRGLALHPQPVRVAELVQSVIGLNRPTANRKRMELQLDLDDRLEAVLDPARMREAFDNVIGNALKYGPLGGRVVVQLKVAGGGKAIRFSVRDQGPGIASVDQPRLFQRFQTLGSVPSGGEWCTGLGLSIVKTIVEMHGGKVGCESELGQGALFWIELPARPEGGQ